MTAFRGRLRIVALAWLLCQAASLAAFVPGECCAAHAAEAKAKAEKACHQSEPEAAPKEGDACPMHSGQSHDCCKMTNSCAGPGVQLVNLFAFVGVLETPRTSSVIIESTAAFVPAQPALLHSLAIPDAPPPKA